MAFILQIPMISTELTFQIKRHKFPVKISFSIIINKERSQILKYIGLGLRFECFSQGQFYVESKKI